MLKSVQQVFIGDMTVHVRFCILISVLSPFPHPSWDGHSVTDCQSSICWCRLSPFWGCITLGTALDGIRLQSFNGFSLTVICKQVIWVWGMGLQAERRWRLVKFVLFVVKMFYISHVLFLIAYVGIPCNPADIIGKYPTNSVRIASSSATHSHLSQLLCLAAASI